MDLELNNVFFAFGFLLLSFILSQFLRFLLNVYLKYHTDKSRNKVDDFLIAIFDKPIPLLVVLGGVYGFGEIIGFPDRTRDYLNVAVLVGVFLIIMHLAVRINDTIFKQIINPVVDMTTKGKDYQLPLRFLRRLINIIIYVFAVIILISIFEYDTSSLLAGLGISGLAIGFAARDTLSNIISSVVLTVMDRNFNVGDRIKVDEKFEGKVIAVGIRSTLIKAENGSKLYIPNAKMASSVIENFGLGSGD